MAAESGRFGSNRGRKAWSPCPNRTGEKHTYIFPRWLFWCGTQSTSTALSRSLFFSASVSQATPETGFWFFRRVGVLSAHSSGRMPPLRWTWLISHPGLRRCLSGTQFRKCGRVVFRSMVSCPLPPRISWIASPHPRFRADYPLHPLL